jgi:hypothetical protein
MDLGLSCQLQNLSNVQKGSAEWTALHQLVEVYFATQGYHAMAAHKAKEALPGTVEDWVKEAALARLQAMHAEGGGIGGVLLSKDESATGRPGSARPAVFFFLHVDGRKRQSGWDSQAETKDEHPSDLAAALLAKKEKALEAMVEGKPHICRSRLALRGHLLIAVQSSSSCSASPPTVSPRIAIVCSPTLVFSESSWQPFPISDCRISCASTVTGSCVKPWGICCSIASIALRSLRPFRGKTSTSAKIISSSLIKAGSLGWPANK